MLDEERGRPVRVRASVQRVGVPSVEVKIGGLRDSDVWVHGCKYVEDFGLDDFVGEGLDSE